MSYIKYINESIDRSGIGFFFLTKIPLDNEIVSKCKDDKCIKEMMIMAKFGITNKQYSILLFILNQIKLLYHGLEITQDILYLILDTVLRLHFFEKIEYSFNKPRFNINYGNHFDYPNQRSFKSHQINHCNGCHKLTFAKFYKLYCNGCGEILCDICNYNVNMIEGIPFCYDCYKLKICHLCNKVDRLNYNNRCFTCRKISKNLADDEV